MTTTAKDEDKVRLERFDGTEPAGYKRWRRKAELMLMALPTTFEKTRWGPKLCEFISGEAEELVEHLTVDELCKEDGYQKVLEALDEKYQKRKQEEAQTYLREYFYKCVIKQGETYRQFIVRLETTYRHLSQHSITLPEEVKGWLLLKKLCLDATQEALVLTAAAGSLKYAELTAAIYKVMPEGKCNSSIKAKEVFMHEGSQQKDEGDEQVCFDEENEVFEALADYAQEEGADYEDALEVYEAYQEIRKRMQNQKMARGFRPTAPPPLRLTGTMQAKIQQLKDRTKCHICLQPGHWKRECPRKDSRKNATFGGKATGKKGEPSNREGHDSMVADYEHVYHDGTLMSHEARELSVSQNEVFFSEKDLGALETLLVNEGSASSSVQPGGALKKAEFSEVFESHFGDRFEQDSEAYMCEQRQACCLSTHAVPDTACRKTLVGEQVLKDMETKLKEKGKRLRFVRESNVFRFGNSECLDTDWTVLIPAQFGHKSVVIRAAVLPHKGSQTPLLLSKELLKQLGTSMDLSKGEVWFSNLGVRIRMGTTSRGHFAIPIVGNHDEMMDDDDDATYTKHMCTHETLQTEEQREKRAVTSQETQDQCAAHSVRGPYTCYVEQQDDEQPCQSDLPGPAQGHSEQKDSGGRREKEDSGTDAGPVTRSAKRRARRRRAYERLQFADRKIQGQDVQRDLCGKEGLCRLDPQECSLGQPKVLSQHAGVSPLHRDKGSAQDPAAETREGREGGDSRLDTDTSKSSAAQEQCGVRLGGGDEVTNNSRVQGACHGRDSGSSGEAGEHQPSDPECDAAQDDDRESGEGLSESHGPAKSMNVDNDQVMGTCNMTKAERRKVKKAIENLIQQEKHAVDVMTVCEQNDQQDFMEVFSTPHITATAKRMSLRADHAFDVKLGCDLRSPESRKHVVNVVKQKKPGVLVVCPPCGPFSTLQRLRKHRGEEYEKALTEAKEFVEFAMELCTLQHTHGRKFVFEHPWLAASWQQESVLRVLELEGVIRVRTDQCMFGLKDYISQKLHKKSTGIMTNCAEIAERVGKTCSHDHEHEPIFGSVKTPVGWKRRSELAQRYPRKLVHAILAGYLEYRENEKKKHVVSTVYAVEIFSKEKDPQRIMQAVKRCHENLEHPSNARLVAMLRSAHANEETIKIAKGLTCPACETRQVPASRPVAKERRAWEFNKQIMVDTFDVDVLGRNLKFLNVVDEATGYQMVAPMWHGKSSVNVRSCYRKYWKRWAGIPLRVLMDNGREFDQEFLHGLEYDGSYYDTTAAYSPHQNGMAERRGGVWKNTFLKTVENVSPTNRHEVDEIVDQTNFAVNTLPRMDGYSPHQHVFGKEHGIPGNLELRDEKLGETSALQAGETMYLRRQEIRNKAQQSYIQAHEEDRVKRAVNHRTRPIRGPYNPGDMVYFWRMWPKEKKASWHGPGTVVGYHDGKSKLWVASGMKMYKCSPEQLRRVSPEQESLIRMMPEDLSGIQKNIQGRGSGNYVDLSTQSKPPEMEQESNDMELSLDRDVVVVGDGSVGDRRVRPRIDDDMDMEVPTPPSGEPDNAGITSPYEPESPVETPQGMHAPTEAMTESLDSDEPQQEPGQTNPSPEGGNDVEMNLPSPEAVQMSGEFGPVRTQNALMTALRRNVDMLDLGGPIRGQGSQQRHGHEVHMHEKRRGRKEVFERELSACHDMGLRRAKKKEWNKLISSGAVRVLSREESEKIRQDEYLSSRILKSRFVLTKADEAELSPSTEIKARWCIRGYLDPDILSLDTEAPTLSAEGAAIALQNIASHQWDLQICDVEGAFLRGDDLHRQQGWVFVSQPPGGLEDLEPGILIEAVKAVYGLADAPLAWYESFSKTLLELQCRRSKLDGCVYYAYSAENPKQVIGVIALHVDDMCLGGNSEFTERILKPLKEKYPFKHWHEKKGNFLGRWLEQLPNGDITIQQTEYAKSVKGIEISS